MADCSARLIPSGAREYTQNICIVDINAKVGLVL